MKRRRLAVDGLTVPELSLGTMNFGSDMFGRAVAESEARAIVDAALESGCDLFDTADVYGRGASEEMLGRLLAGRRERALIATKVLGAMADGDPGGLSAARIAARLDDSLRRLRTDRVDLYMPHAPDPRAPLDETLEALSRAVRAGKVRAWGLSNYPADAVRAARRAGLPGGPAFVQTEFSLVARDGERDWARLWEQTGIPVLAWSPLAGGLLTGKYLVPGAAGRLNGPRPFPPYPPARYAPLARMLDSRSRRAGSSAARTALAWVLARPWAASAVCGVSAAPQWRELCGAALLVLLLAAAPVRAQLYEHPRAHWRIDFPAGWSKADVAGEGMVARAPKGSARLTVAKESAPKGVVTAEDWERVNEPRLRRRYGVTRTRVRAPVTVRGHGGLRVEFDFRDPRSGAAMRGWRTVLVEGGVADVLAFEAADGDYAASRRPAEDALRSFLPSFSPPPGSRVPPL